MAAADELAVTPLPPRPRGRPQPPVFFGCRRLMRRQTGSPAASRVAETSGKATFPGGHEEWIGVLKGFEAGSSTHFPKPKSCRSLPGVRGVCCELRVNLPS